MRIWRGNKMSVYTNPEEFKLFNNLLIADAPEGFQPFYFPLERNGKEPRKGISWKKNRKTFRESHYLMKNGFNIGIAGTDNDKLCIVDIDDLIQVPDIKESLQVTSRKRIGRHNYFFAPDCTAKKNIPTKDAGEVRSVWQYVLVPGSYVPCSEDEINQMPYEEKQFAGHYTLNNNAKVVGITFDELPEVYKLRYEEMRQDEIKMVIREVNKKEATYKNIKHKSALWDLDISDVSGVGDTRGRKVPMPDIVHGSDTGHNCSVSNGLLHCWRHYTTQNAFSYLAILAGVASCERAGRPHGGRSYGVDFQDGYTVYDAWEYAKRAGFIPDDDPIPHSALIYYALKNKICKKTDLIDGKLSDTLYQITLLMSKREGLNFGR